MTNSVLIELVLVKRLQMSIVWRRRQGFRSNCGQVSKPINHLVGAKKKDKREKVETTNEEPILTM